jgi:flagellar protein FliS
MSLSYSGRSLQAYRQTEVQASSPLELVVMLYDGALRFTAEARQAIERGDIAARRVAVDRTLAIIIHLQSTLDLERGGAIAADLHRLYDYVSRRMLDASMQNTVAPLDDARQVLQSLREGWQGAARAAKPSPATMTGAGSGAA